MCGYILSKRATIKEIIELARSAHSGVLVDCPILFAYQWNEVMIEKA